MAIAEFPPSDSLGRIRAGQRASLRLDGFPWTEYGKVAGEVTGVASEPRSGKIRVELRVLPESAPAIRLQHGLPGSLEIEVERISPAALVLPSLVISVRNGNESPTRKLFVNSTVAFAPELSETFAPAELPLAPVIVIVYVCPI